jgi:hypothetical protein
MKNSGLKYRLVTTFPNQNKNVDIVMPGDWCALNFQKEPFNFPKPLIIINEKSPARGDKSLALWKIEDLPKLLINYYSFFAYDFFLAIIIRVCGRLYLGISAPSW